MDPSILKQYIFQKGFVTEAAKAKREAEAQNATLQACTWREECVALNSRHADASMDVCTIFSGHVTLFMTQG